MSQHGACNFTSIGSACNHPAATFMVVLAHRQHEPPSQVRCSNCTKLPLNAPAAAQPTDGWEAPVKCMALQLAIEQHHQGF